MSESRIELRSPRLLLREWSGEQDDAMAAINRDPEVTRFLNRQGGRREVAAFSARVRAHWREHGFGFFEAWELPAGGAMEFIGFIGCAHPAFVPELAHRVEIGWRLGRAAWGRGLATEGAELARDDAFERIGLDELISIIDPGNERSQRVAAKLGMKVESHVKTVVKPYPVEVWSRTAPTNLTSPAGR